MHIKDIIVNYRTENRYSQRAFAAKCGLSNGYISMIEKNVNPSTGKPTVFTYQTLKKLAFGLDMSVNDLVAMADDMDIDVSESQQPGGTEIVMVNKPSDSMETADVRKFLHNLIDELSDEDLFFMKDISLRIVRK